MAHSPSAPLSDNAQKAYAKDWAHFAAWCQRTGTSPLATTPNVIGRYLTDQIAAQNGQRSPSARTLERRLSGLTWHLAHRGITLDRQAPPIAAALADIRQKHARPTQQKLAIRSEDIRAMTATLPPDLRGLRDKAILLLGYAGGLRRSQIVSLDLHKGDTSDTGNWISIRPDGALLALAAKTGRHEITIGRGSSPQTCPVHALEQWLHFAKIDAGPIFVRTSRDGKKALPARLNDKHVARLIKQTVLAAGIRSDLPVKERLALFSGQSLRHQFQENRTSAAGLLGG